MCLLGSKFISLLGASGDVHPLHPSLSFARERGVWVTFVEDPFFSKGWFDLLENTCKRFGQRLFVQGLGSEIGMRQVWDLHSR
ncbi:hypothetical protein CEXT_744181 [Caerostris extrusa]|uniref:Uncharacterized protein n=1 Tax=Caerostris extrusa TaxID=172846 RepID=A0AAV4QAW4_CAEEX|nr:hypothetical protein CEXT_744181 [Caerostris extrusa]